jgi:hypothetical protein
MNLPWLDPLQAATGAVCLLLVILYRKALAFPEWLYTPEEWATVSRMEVARAFLVGLLLAVVISLAAIWASQTLIEERTGQEVLYALPFLACGWAAGRFGGRYGLACAVTLILVLFFFMPVGAFLAWIWYTTSSQQGLAAAELILHSWGQQVVPIAPAAILLTLAPAMVGAWQAKKSVSVIKE